MGQTTGKPLIEQKSGFYEGTNKEGQPGLYTGEEMHKAIMKGAVEPVKMKKKK